MKNLLIFRTPEDLLVIFMLEENELKGNRTLKKHWGQWKQIKYIECTNRQLVSPRKLTEYNLYAELKDKCRICAAGNNIEKPHSNCEY